MNHSLLHTFIITIVAVTDHFLFHFCLQQIVLLSTLNVFCFQLEVGWRGNSESTKLEKTISKPWQVRHSAFVDRIKVEISSYTGSTTRTEQLLDDESMKIYLL